MDLAVLQATVRGRWRLQDSNPCHQSATTHHMLVHMTKALGKVASAMNDAEHESRVLHPEEVLTCLADLVICASQFASDAGIDIDAACASRIEQKFPVNAQASREW